MKKYITQLILVSIMTLTQSCADYGRQSNTAKDSTNNQAIKPYPPAESSEKYVQLFQNTGPLEGFLNKAPSKGRISDIFKAYNRSSL